jgi:hypothetical protein
MAMKPTDRLIAPSRATAAQAIAFATSNGAARLGEVTAYVQEVYRLAPLVGLDPSITVAQSVHETSVGPRPWASTWWVQRLNPAGIGITGDPAQNAQSHTWATGTEAAGSHLSHLLVYALGPADAGSKWYQVTGESIRSVDVRYDAYVEAYGNRAMAETIADLAGTWAVDKRYAEGICARGNAVYPTLPDQSGATMPTFTTTVPGVPGGPLITTYRIRTNLIAVDGYQRTGKKAAKPRRSVQHGTGNPSNQSAMAEAQYFVNGAEGRQASVHACSDDTEVVITMPLDEVGWHAADGAGPGNMNGYACEMMEATAIWTNTARRDKLIAITADFMGRCAARFDVSKPERHWDFNANSPNRHHCPDKLMDTGLWETAYVPRWQAARIDELRRMGGQAPVTPTTTTTAPPIAYPPNRIPAPDYLEAQGYELIVNEPNRYRCTQGGRFKTAPSLDAPDAGSTPYKAGRTYTFDFSTRAGGEAWLVSKAGSWAPLKNFTAA